MLWDGEQDGDLLAFYQALIAFRRTGGDAWRRQRNPLALESSGLYVVSLGEEDSPVATLALDRGDRDQTVAVPPAFREAVARIATDDRVGFHPEHIALPARPGCALLRPE